jgi:hypothetical protein
MMMTPIFLVVGVPRQGYPTQDWEEQTDPCSYSDNEFGAPRDLAFALQKLRRPEANCFPAAPRLGEKLASNAKRACFSRD